ncbi:hypothetical protein AIT68_005335 [Salmonella enterica subsp. salamae]|uniref:hypothetical protein n=1 Tax=Salmonella enterica TaxID=28901 RepID=UPI0012BA1BBE|nr:hypothetical protein [Salmonella enterica]EBQ5245998.1 hypothetical protein [Salmonella enterica subsp. salamae]
MTTITREQLHERARRKVKELEFAITQSAFTSIRDGLNEELELARIALASLTAEPVGYFYADKPGDWYQISDGDRVPDHRRIPLYSSPQPAQVVKLPNEFISNEGIVVQIEKVMAVLAVHGIQYKRRGNACSAAMLQAGTLTNEGTKQAGNSPVIPDGWVMVPKTATPEISQAINKVGQHCTCGNCSQRLWDMLLAAAQKPETGSCTK